MYFKTWLSLFTSLVFTLSLIGGNATLAQTTKTGLVTGQVRDANTQEPLVGATVVIDGQTVGTVTDIDGRYKLSIPVGTVNLKASYVGYAPQVRFNIVISTGNVQNVNFELAESEAAQQSEVEIVADRKKTVRIAKIETPLSVNSLTTEEIKSNPGGNFDISRVVQALPGVAGATGGGLGFRNDIIIRGGAPNENVFYLDGIEIPVINHFQTQGSAGGPAGILNVSFIEEVNVSRSAFEARYDNPLASVFQFKQKEGSTERFQGNLRLSATELALTTEGPLGPKTTFLASARRSYLQLLFQAIDLPIRPNYWDYQFKVTHRFSEKTTLTLLGVGAIDEFSFAVPRNSTPEKEYALRSVPSVNQWNYTIGASLKHLIDKGYINISLSRNMFDNQLDRFEDNKAGDESRRALRLRSDEIENKLRADITKFFGPWKVSAGIMAQNVKFKNDFTSKITNTITDSLGNVLVPARFVNFDSFLEFFRYGGFAQLSRAFLDNKLTASFGIRTDMNNFTTTGNNPLETLSPRLSMSYSINDQWSVSGSVGTYYKVPIYTVLGFRDQAGNFVNKDNKYIKSTHYTAGVEYIPRESIRFTIEGFYKLYDNVPVSDRTGISLANQGVEFTAVGNERTLSTGKGTTYGAEFYYQQKLATNYYAVFSYTFVRSLYSGKDGNLIASAWDNQHLISALFGYKFGKNWELGVKYRFAGGTPFTPFDLDASRRNYLLTGQGTLDLNRVNTERVGNFNQVDFRIDKKWNFNRITLDLYLDVQNTFRFVNPAPPQYTFERLKDGSNWATTDGQPVRADGSNATPVLLINDDALVLPTLGFIVEF